MTACKRVWEVEAVRDGRLTGNERLSMERHIGWCADCGLEQQRLEALAAALSDLPVSGANELSLRRQRHELLARAHQLGSFGARRTSWTWQRTTTAFVAAGLACVAAFTGIRFWVLSEDTSLGARLALRPSADTDYTRQTRDGSEIVDLKQGRLTLEVERVDERSGVLVRTPDGEIEDIGTVFTVSVQGGRTELISVAKGRVVARIVGKPERKIMAGETHRPYATDGAGRTAVLAPPAPEKPVQATRAGRERRRASEVASGTQLSAARTAASKEIEKDEVATRTVAQDPASESEVAAEFARVVARVEAHDDARALALLRRFMERFPHDSRAEDAAFLSVVVLARGSDLSAMRASAHAYLAKYPGGFRAPEVVRLLEQSDTQHAPRAE